MALIRSRIDYFVACLWLFLRCSEDYENGRPLVTSLCMSRGSLELGKRIFVAENPVCAVLPTLSLGSLNIVVCPVNNSCNFAGNYVLSFWSWNDIITQTNGAPVLKYITARPSFQRRRKIRRHRRPWAYYSNTTATFHDLLIVTCYCFNAQWLPTYSTIDNAVS